MSVKDLSSIVNFNQLPKQLAVVIPAFNEAQSIECIVHQVNAHAVAIVVDDGSTDDTATLARAAGAIVVTHPVNLGYDGALETGLRTARALHFKFVVTIDADGQHDPTLLLRFLTELENGADLVVGHRDRTQRWSETLFCLISRAVWGLNDPLCGMKGYRMATLAGVEDLNTYASIGTELAVRLMKSGVRTSQPRIKIGQRAGVSRFGDGIKANLRISKSLWIGLRVHAVSGGRVF